MHLGIQFQYKDSASARPYDGRQVEDLNFEVPAGAPPAILVPNTGDTISLKDLVNPDGHQKAYKVLTRHFSYSESTLGMYISVNVVVTDVDGDEMAARLKE